MRSILEELYNGRIFPAELIVPKDLDYCSVNQTISDLKETWQQKLSTEDFKLLEALLELYYESSTLEASASFGYGFKLGALLMLEVLGGREELVRRGRE